MPDRHAVVWTRTARGPLKMGSLVATPTECRFSYSAEFLAAGSHDGLALLAHPVLFGTEPVVYRTSARMPLHPRLMAMLPSEAPGNIQRRIYTEILARRERPPAPGFETEWEILLMAGHDGIGHVDVFRDDRAATDWYARPQHPETVIGARSAVWRFIREDVRQTTPETDVGVITELLGPTPSVGGMIPKLLVAIPDGKAWSGRFAPPGTRAIEGRPFIDVILKIEPPQYEGVLALEALCLELHADLGFRVPRHWRAEVDGMRLLAVERFDRAGDGLPVPMESFLSVMASGSREVLGTADTDMRAVGAMLEKLATLVNLDTRRAQHEVYRRFLLAFLTGNGDLHLENLSFLGGPDAVDVAPVYDPAPMRAWPRHDLRSAIPIEFDPALGLGENLAELGTAFGYSRRQAAELLRELLDATADYPERVRTLHAVPEIRRQRLSALVDRERATVLSTLD